MPIRHRPCARLHQSDGRCRDQFLGAESTYPAMSSRQSRMSELIPKANAGRALVRWAGEAPRPANFSVCLPAAKSCKSKLNQVQSLP